ncbi:MAG: class I SAM-dependent methyltransferase, partial [Candidatus Dormibacteraeota bacterium]|nr:class I SAM-dependent methyltransferase [Candidatus Dormibacteraeota bacterium]
MTRKPYFFNGQRARRRVFAAVNDKIRFENYIETGTYLGMTAYFLAATAAKRRAQVYSCEINAEFFAVASRSLRWLNNVHLHHGDSVAFLRALDARVSESINFIYLDAHWYDQLPLADELAVICNWRNSVVMIDDFKVPFDRGFGWD